MTQCTVHGNSIGKNQGPGYMSAQIASEDINNSNPTWLVTFDHKEYETVFTATGPVSYDALKAALETQLGAIYLYS